MGKKKTKKVGGWIFISFLLLSTNVLTMTYFLYLRPSTPNSDVPMDIGDIAEKKETLLGETLSITGYYLKAANYSLLVTNPQNLFNNSLNSQNTVQILGEIPASMTLSLGMPCIIKGTLEEVDASDGALGILFESLISKETEPLIKGNFQDTKYNPYPKFDLIEKLDLTTEKYAVLYSGGIQSNMAYYRYWNDIIYMYFILQMNGYPTENIYVIYKDGVGEDSYTPVHYPAVHSSLDTVFGILSEEMGRADDLFFYTTNHGGNDGISTWWPMASASSLTHNEVATWLDSISCHQMIVVMEQCVSGKFIPYLSAPNRVIMTACSDGESSYACDDEGNWDEFVYHFMCAVAQVDWNNDGTIINSDFNNDGLISMTEAFIWASGMDSRNEMPLYNDDGGGVGKNFADVLVSYGTLMGENVFI